MKRSPLTIAFLLAGLSMSSSAHAGGWPVYDALVHQGVLMVNMSVQAVTAAVNGTTGAVNAMNQNLARILNDIGTAVNENGQKVASTIEADGKSTREYITEQERQRRLEDARQRYYVGSNICSESASGGAYEIAGAAQSTKGSMRPGGSRVSNKQIAQAINTPPVSPEIDTSRAAKIHAQFCDADDYASYGGSQACPGISQSMPGADKRVDSVLAGAGPNGKTPDLTFNQEQTDAALMYVQNSARRSIAPQLKRGEADTVAGSQYVGLMNQYNAVISAAADPQEQRIANSQPSEATKELIKEAVISPAAKAYFDQAASQEARRTGMMSAREFESFEVGRRYANTEYQADLQAMSGDNLLREQIRITSLQNWLMLGIKDQLEKANIINGLTLASSARTEFEPVLAAKYRAVSGRMGGQ